MSPTHPPITLYPTLPLNRWLGSSAAIGVACVGAWFLWRHAGQRFEGGNPSVEQVIVAAILVLIAIGALAYMLLQVRYRIARGIIHRQYTLLGYIPLLSRPLTPLADAELVDEGYATEGTVFADPGDTYIDEDGMEQQKLIKEGRIGRFRLWLWHNQSKILIADNLESREEIDGVFQLQRWAQGVAMQTPPPRQ